MNAFASFPSNELEESLQAAAETGDDAKLLRALARNVVCLAQPGPGPPSGRPEVREYAPGERPLPVAAGNDERPHVLVFTSYAQLDRWYRDPQVVWSQVAAGVLAAEWPHGHAFFLNPGGDCSVVLEPEDVQTIALLFAGANVPEAIRPGPATPVRTAAPSEDATQLFDPLRRVVAGHPDVLEIRYGLLTLAEPEARVWPVIGLRFREGADYPPVMEEASAAVASSGIFGELRRLDPATEDPIERWLLDEGRLVADMP